MSDDQRFKDNKIFTQEMVDAARQRLKDHFAKMQGEANRSVAEPDTESGADPDEFDRNDEDDLEDDEDEPDIDDLLPFTLAEQALIDQLGATVRKRMVSAEPATLKKIASFLHALERLPYATPGVSLDLAFMERVDENLSYTSVELSEQAFRLSTGGSVYSPDVGGDSFSETSFEIETGGFRDGSTAAFDEWLDAFVSAGGTIEIEGDDDVDLTEAAPGDGWDRLEKYWETHWEDADGW